MADPVPVFNPTAFAPEQSEPIDSGFSLSGAETTRLQVLLQTLLSPVDEPTADGWRLAVNRGLQALLGAEMVTFRLRAPRVQEFVSDQLDQQTLSRYPAYLSRSSPCIRCSGSRSPWERGAARASTTHT